MNPWRFQFLFHEIWALSSRTNVGFCHELKSTTFMADALAQVGVERLSP